MRCKLILFLALLPVAVPAFDRSAAVRAESMGKARIAALISHSAAPYYELLEGFESSLLKAGKHADVRVYVIEGSQFKMNEVFEKIREERTGLILAVGSHAAEAAMRDPAGLPVVAGMVLSPAELKGKANSTGVVMELPFEVQFQKLRQILPQCRNIGVVYSAVNALQMESAAKAASSAGLSLYARQVKSPSEIPDALEYLANHIDVLMSVPDDLVFTAQTARHILLYSFRNRIPLVGLSDSWVKAGALYSLEWDYKDLGAQCAEMAERIMDGAAPGSIAPAYPRKILYSLNLKTAAHMKLEIPENIIHGAARVYDER